MKYYRQICLNTYGDSTTVLGMSPDFLWRLKAVAGEVAQNIGDYPNTGMVTYNCYLRGRQFLESFLKALLWLLKWSLEFFFRSVVSWWVDKLIDAIFGFNCALKEVLHAVKIKIGDYPRTHVKLESSPVRGCCCRSHLQNSLNESKKFRNNTAFE